MKHQDTFEEVSRDMHRVQTARSCQSSPATGVQVGVCACKHTSSLVHKQYQWHDTTATRNGLYKLLYSMSLMMVPPTKGKDRKHPKKMLCPALHLQGRVQCQILFKGNKRYAGALLNLLARLPHAHGNQRIFTHLLKQPSVCPVCPGGAPPATSTHLLGCSEQQGTTAGVHECNKAALYFTVSVSP